LACAHSRFFVFFEEERQRERMTEKRMVNGIFFFCLLALLNFGVDDRDNRDDRDDRDDRDGRDKIYQPSVICHSSTIFCHSLLEVPEENQTTFVGMKKNQTTY